MRWGLVLASAVVFAAPLKAQEADIAPAPAPPVSAPMPILAPSVPAGSDVAPFYAARPGNLVWLRSPESRAAVAKLAEILKRAPIDGFADGPALAASVEAALTSGTPADDQIISAAWVRYVQALKRPVGGMNFGDPALQLRPPSAREILSDAVAAPSLAAHLDAVANVNSFYATLRADAIESGQQSDPRVTATLDRLRLIPGKGKAILVDAANAELMMLEDGKVIDTMKVIVGKADFATPLIASKIWYVTFNPYWHIPQDVTKRKVAPIVLKRGVKYLKAARYETVEAFGGDKEVPIDPESIDWKAVAAGEVDAHIRQLTGPNNMMGKMKFGFANDHGIFLHDTPHKELFDKSKRNLSLGCVRVERPPQLAEWLFGGPPPIPSDDAEQNVRIGKEGVPIYISYLTARPDGEKIAFADDVYKLDGKASAGSGDKAIATASAAKK